MATRKANLVHPGRKASALSDAAITRVAGEDPEVVSDKQEWYYAMDGDDMGHTIEDALIENDIAASQKLEKQIIAAFAEIAEYVTSVGGKIIFNGGDNVLFTAGGNPKDVAEKARGIYRDHTDHSATVGVGHEPVEAHKALVVGKNTGKDQVIVWDESHADTYEEIKKQQVTLEKCEEEVREESDLELGSSPALKYRAEKAQAHYKRLRGVGYDHTAALTFVNDLYKLADSYRDILQRRKRPLAGNTPGEKYLRDGEQKWKQFADGGFVQQSSEMAVEAPAVPTVGQKIVTPTDFGRVALVGSRFVSIEWLKSGKRERVAISKFQEMEKAQQLASLPQVRTARRTSTALRS